MSDLMITENRRLSARCSDLVAELERKRRGLKRFQLAGERQPEAEARLPDEETRRARLKSEVSELRKAKTSRPPSSRA